jgi:hypothetical protein
LPPQYSQPQNTAALGRCGTDAMHKALTRLCAKSTRLRAVE